MFIMISNVLALVLFSLFVLTYMVPIIDICCNVNNKLKSAFSCFLVDTGIIAISIFLLFSLVIYFNS